MSMARSSGRLHVLPLLLLSMGCLVVQAKAQSRYDPWRDCERYGSRAAITGQLKRYMQAQLGLIEGAIGALPAITLCEATNFSNIVGAFPAERRLVYSRETFAAWAASGRSEPGAILLLGHEIGHIILNHQGGSELTIRRDELAADEFAGYVLRRLGLDPAKATQIFDTLGLFDQPQRSLPGKRARIAAVQRGFERGTPPAAVTGTAPSSEPVLEPDAAPRTSTPQTVSASAGNKQVTEPEKAAGERGEPFTLIGLLEESAKFIAAIGGAIGVLYGGYKWFMAWRRRRRRKRIAGDPRAGILREMLENPPPGTEWRKLDTLARAIGADEAETTRLLIDIGARRSLRQRNVWALATKKPLRG